jgi:hypothetical protein
MTRLDPTEFVSASATDTTVAAGPRLKNPRAVAESVSLFVDAIVALHYGGIVDAEAKPVVAALRKMEAGARRYATGTVGFVTDVPALEVASERLTTALRRDLVIWSVSIARRAMMLQSKYPVGPEIGADGGWLGIGEPPVPDFPSFYAETAASSNLTMMTQNAAGKTQHQQGGGPVAKRPKNGAPMQGRQPAVFGRGQPMQFPRPAQRSPLPCHVHQQFVATRGQSPVCRYGHLCKFAH